MHGVDTVLNVMGSVALLLWGVRMVRTGLTRAFGAALRRALPGQPALRSVSMLTADGRVLASSNAENLNRRLDAGVLPAVALAQDALRLLQRQQTAVNKAMVEAQDRFELGDAPVTDTHEAAARARGIDAQVLAAEVDLQIAQRALADTTGWSADALQVAPAPALLASPALPALPQWLDQAAAANPGLRQQTLAVEVARQDVAQYARGAGTTVDLVAQASREHLSGSGRYGHGSNTAQQHMVGVQVTVPLYTGGQRSARQQELLHLQTKAEAELDRARQQVAQQTRAAWLRLQSGAARTEAQNAALRASQARLDATQLGRQVGDRTTLDLLNAQNDAAGAELAMAQLRTSLTLERLRLLALTGQLDERALHAATVDAPAPK